MICFLVAEPEVQLGLRRGVDGDWCMRGARECFGLARRARSPVRVGRGRVRGKSESVSRGLNTARTPGKARKGREFFFFF